MCDIGMIIVSRFEANRPAVFKVVLYTWHEVHIFLSQKKTKELPLCTKNARYNRWLKFYAYENDKSPITDWDAVNRK